MMDNRREPCPNCPCCEATVYCDGCGETLCVQCWAEHNEDAPCHLRDREDREDFTLVDGVEEGQLRKIVFLIPFDPPTPRAE
jgi:hypothetical protein